MEVWKKQPWSYLLMLPNQPLRMVVLGWCGTNILSMSHTKWHIHLLYIHVAHVNVCCKRNYASSRLWLFSHALILPKKTSFNIVEHGMDLNVDVMGMKTTKTTRFPNQNKNKGMHSYISKSWNKKNKNKSTTLAKQESNKILLQRRNRIRLWQENIPKIGVEKLKVRGNSTFIYIY
jgi:hypothetical protein